VDLLHELWPQLLQWNVGEALELVLIGQGTDHSLAVPLLKETFQEAPNSILLIDGLTEPLLVLQRLLQVVF